MRSCGIVVALSLCIGCATSSDTVAADSASRADSAAAPVPTPAAQPAVVESFRAAGQEPGWLLVLSDSLRLQWDYDARRLVVGTPPMQLFPDGRTYGFVHQDTVFTILITSAPCADAMSGHEYPQTVTVRIAERVLKGCGGEPGRMLQGAEWSVDLLEGKPLVAGSSITMQFTVDASVAGTAGCNRYRGRFDVRGTELTVGPAMSTRMACRPAIDQQETRFLAALARPLRYYVEGGVLHLTRENTTVVTARRR